MKCEILCIGNASYDMFFSLDEYPAENKKYAVNSIRESSGVPASNEAYLLSKWGVKCAFIGLIGNDIYGKKIISDFKKVKTDFRLTEVRKNFPTPLSNIIINKKNGSRTIINRRTFDNKIKINLKKLAKYNPQVLLFDGNELDTALTSLEMFDNAVSILDAGSLRKETLILSKKTDYLVCSEDFAKSYTGMDKLKNQNDYKKCMQKLKELNNKNIVVTLGENGLFYNTGSEVKHMEAFKVNAVDTTGAGDVFHGAFAYSILKKLSLEETLKLSSCAAALSAAKEGGRDSIPELNDVLKKESGAIQVMKSAGKKNWEIKNCYKF